MDEQFKEMCKKQLEETELRIRKTVDEIKTMEDGLEPLRQHADKLRSLLGVGRFTAKGQYPRKKKEEEKVEEGLPDEIPEPPETGLDL